MKTYQVGIIGAGPAGSYLARSLSAAGVSVVVFERSKTIGEPNFSSGGASAYILDRFGLPKESIAAYWDRFRIVGPSKHFLWEYPSPVGVVFDFRKLKQMLIEKARNNGAEILSGMAVSGIRHAGDSWIVQIGEKDTAYRADIIVDASGPAGVVASQVGLRARVLGIPSSGLEEIVDAPLIPSGTERTLEFYLGNAFAPHGYAWVFPMGGNRVKMGVCTLNIRPNRKNVSLIDQLHTFQKRIPWYNHSSSTELHGGAIFVTGGLRRHVLGTVMAIGDSACQIHPLGGEGIRHALQSAQFAYRVILEALSSGDKNSLLTYEALWKKYRGAKWYWGMKLAKLLYGRSSDKLWNLVLRRFNRFSAQDVFDIFFEYRFAKIFKMLF